VIPDDELEARRLAKAIARLVAQVSQYGGTPDMVFLPTDAADDLGVKWLPAEPETAEGNE
jgi:hypothetical protein